MAETRLYLSSFPFPLSQTPLYGFYCAVEMPRPGLSSDRTIRCFGISLSHTAPSVITPEPRHTSPS